MAYFDNIVADTEVYQGISMQYNFPNIIDPESLNI